MFAVVSTVFCTAIASILGFALSKLAINLIHNMWFDLERKDEEGLQAMASYGGAVVSCGGALIACIVNDGAIAPVAQVIFWATLGWQVFLWALSIFLVVSRWLGQIIDSLTGPRS
jgi:hypothetical protein